MSNVIFKCIFGSHLYGLETENSDTDIKGIFIPTFEEIVLGSQDVISIKTGNDKSKNTKDDVDTELYSLKKFLELACKGETVVLDMIHSDKYIISSDEWDFIRKNRSKFYSKNMRSYLGYVNKQAAKYGVKGSRMAALEQLVTFLKSDIKANRLKDVYDDLPVNEFCVKTTSIGNRTHLNELPCYEVLGRKYLTGVPFENFREGIFNLWNEYGERSRKVKNNEGVDWKAVSHAIRGGEQLLEIFETGDLKYPLKNRDFILDVKLGKLDFVTQVQPYLEELLDRVDKAATESDFPDTVDKTFWDRWLVDVYKKMVE